MDRRERVRRLWHRLGVTASAVVAVGLVVAPVPANAAKGDGSTKPDLSGVTIRVGYSAVRDTATHDVRMASGALDDTPYDIKWVPFQTGAIEALAAGAVDVVADSFVLGILVAQAGAKTPWTRATAPYRIIGASVAPPAAGAVIAVRPGSGIKKIADLKGKKVVYGRASVSQLFWEFAARDAKLKDGDVEEVQLPVTEARAAFLSGAVDALVAAHRTVIPLESSGDAVVIAKANAAATEYRSTAVRAGFLDDKSQAAAVADFYRRLVKSKAWLPKHTKEAEAIYARSASVSTEDAKLAVAEFPVTVLPLDDELAENLQAQAKIFFDVGVTPTNPKVAILFDRRYAETSRGAPG